MVLDFALLLLKKVLAWLHSSPNSILGIALTLGLWALYRSRNRNNSNRDNSRASAPASDQPNSARGVEGPTRGGASSSSASRLQQQLDLQRQQQHEQQGASTSCDSQEGVADGSGGDATGSARGGDGTGVGAGAGKGGPLQAKLRDLRRVTISVPGVVLEEREVTDSATVRGPETVALLQQLLQAADVYLLAQVTDDIGQAVVTGALEAAGLIGPQPSQLPPQRMLFCSTHPGKQSMVRQIEPDLHVDGDACTVEDLRRFVPQLLWVGTEGAPASGSCAASLVEFFHSS